MPTAPGVSGVVAFGVVVGFEGAVVLGGVVVVGGGVVVLGGGVVLCGAVEDGGVVVLGGAVVGEVSEDGAPVMLGEPVEPAGPIVGLARTKDGAAAAVAPGGPDWTQPVTVTIWVEPDVAERVAGDWVCAAVMAAMEAANTPANSICCLMLSSRSSFIRAAGRPRMFVTLCNPAASLTQTVEFSGFSG